MIRLAIDYLKAEVAALGHSDGELLAEGRAGPTMEPIEPRHDHDLPGMDLLRGMIGSGQAASGNAEHITGFEARFHSDIGILRKDADATIQRYLKYWDRMTYLCDSKLAVVATNILVIPASSVPSSASSVPSSSPSQDSWQAES